MHWYICIESWAALFWPLTYIVGVRPDLLDSNVAIPGDEVDDNIDVVEIRWDLADICPAGSPDSIGELLQESIETPMVQVELILG